MKRREKKRSVLSPSPYRQRILTGRKVISEEGDHQRSTAKGHLVIILTQSPTSLVTSQEVLAFPVSTSSSVKWN